MSSNQFERGLTFGENIGRETRQKSVHFGKDAVDRKQLPQRSGTSLLKKTSQSNSRSAYSANTSQNDSFTDQTETWDQQSTASPTLRSGTSIRTSFKLQRINQLRSREEENVVTLISRPLDKQYSRVKEIERLANLLQKETEEKAKLTDINQYFEEADPMFFDDPFGMKTAEMARRSSTLDLGKKNSSIGANRDKQKEREGEGEADGKGLFKRLRTSTGNAFALTTNSLSGLFSGTAFGKGEDSEKEGGDERFQMNMDASVHPFDEEQRCLMSKMLAPDQFFPFDSQDDQEGNKNTFFASNVKLNDSAMVQYGLKKANVLERKISVDRRSRQGSVVGPPDFVMDDDEEFWERFDSRGKKMKLRRVKVAHPPMRHIPESFAVINFNPNTYITQKDLKLRATSIVYGHYKDLKRKAAVHEQQRRLNWFRSIVIAKKFSKMLLSKAKENLDKRRRAEERRHQEYQKQLYHRQNTRKVTTTGSGNRNTSADEESHHEQMSASASKQSLTRH